MLSIALLLAACSGGAAPADAPATAQWDLPDGKRLMLKDKRLLAETFPLTEDLVGAPTWDQTGHRVVLTERAKGQNGPSTQLVLAEQAASGWSRKVIVEPDSAPDRPALAPDGASVVFVATGPLGGFPGIWRLDIAGGEQIPLTNAELALDGTPPPDLVPVPETAPKYDGATVTWTAKDGEHKVAARP